MAIGGLINDISALFGLPGGDYLDQLQTASWRGREFAVTKSRGRFGRRNAIHDYPFRDQPWVEDLGRGRRQIHVVGFLIGDDVIAQSNRMIEVCEAKSESEASTLVHPVFGNIQVALLNFAIEHSVEGRFAEIEFDFLESGPRVYPTAAASSTDLTQSAADAADGAESDNYGVQIVDALRQGSAAVQSVVDKVAQYGGLIFRLTNDATSLVRAVQSLPGQFGRFFEGASSTFFGLTTAIAGNDTSVTIPRLIASGAHARANVTSAMSTASSGATALEPSSTAAFAGQVQAVTTALAAATVDPADQVRIFTTIVQFTTVNVTIVQTATTDLWRRAALTALARATAAYQPSSYDDAATLRELVVGLLDAETAIAGEQGEDSVFLAFRSLKMAVANDLTTRGASLSPIVTVTFAAALPAPLIAMKLYQDAGRSDEIVAETTVRHPAFMPVAFKVLAT